MRWACPKLCYWRGTRFCYGQTPEKRENQRLILLTLRTVSSHFRSITPSVDNKEKVYDLAWSFLFSFRLCVYIIFCSITEYSQKKQSHSSCFHSSYIARKLVVRADSFMEMIWWAYFMSSRGMNLFLTCSAWMSLVFVRSTHDRGELLWKCDISNVDVLTSALSFLRKYAFNESSPKFWLFL